MAAKAPRGGRRQIERIGGIKVRPRASVAEEGGIDVEGVATGGGVRGAGEAGIEGGGEEGAGRGRREPPPSDRGMRVNPGLRRAVQLHLIVAGGPSFSVGF